MILKLRILECEKDAIPIPRSDNSRKFLIEIQTHCWRGMKWLGHVAYHSILKVVYFRPCGSVRGRCWTYEGWLYLVVVLDLLFRKVVGWALAATLTCPLVEEVLNMAVGWRHPPLRAVAPLGSREPACRARL